MAENDYKLTLTGGQINNNLNDFNKGINSSFAFNVVKEIQNQLTGQTSNYLSDYVISKNKIPVMDNSHLGVNSVGKNQLQTNSVIEEKIDNGAVTPAKLSKTYIAINGKSNTNSVPSTLADNEVYIIYE